MKKIARYSLVAFGIMAGAVLAGCTSNEGEHDDVQSISIQKPIESNNSYVFTANEGGSLSIVDATSNKLLETISIDGSVHNVQVSPDGKMVAVTVVPNMNHGEKKEEEEKGHEHEGMAMKGSAMFIDVENNKVLQTIEVGNHPAHIVFTNDGKSAVVSNNEDNNVMVIDTKSFETTKTIQTGKGPHGFRISANNEQAYVANMGEDSVSVLNLVTGKEEKKIKVGAAPVTTAITSDQQLLAVTLNAENKLAIVDLATDKVTKVAVGKGPAQVYIEHQSRTAYVANQGTADAPSNTVSVVDLDAKKVTATIQVGKGAHGVVTSPDEKHLYVTNMFDHTISVIDLAKKEVVETIKVGKVPNGISYLAE